MNNIRAVTSVMEIIIDMRLLSQYMLVTGGKNRPPLIEAVQEGSDFANGLEN